MSVTNRDEKMLVTEVTDDAVLTVRLNHPEKMNAIATPLLRQLAELLQVADENETIRVIVITGNNKVFAAGADINELRTRQAHDGLSDPRPALWEQIRNIRKPIIAAVEGYCLGAGNELLMCCDIAVAGGGATFGQPETNLGIIPGAGGASLLPRLVGQQCAMRMVLLAEFLSADEACSFGLISEVVEKGGALTQAHILAKKIAKRAPLAMLQGKAIVRAAQNTALPTHLAMERQAFSLLLSTQDKQTGVEAFLGKTKAEWQGE